MADRYRKLDVAGEPRDIPYKPVLIPRREGKRAALAAAIAAPEHRRPMKADNGGERARVRTREGKKGRERGPPAPSP